MRLLGRARSAPRRTSRAPAEIVYDALWSLPFTIAAGTSQIQRNIIAERILGLPKDR